MKIYLGADHKGFHLKNKVFAYLQKRGFEVEDVSSKELDPSDDFPQFAAAVSLKIIGDDSDARGILLCGGGQGMAMAANRFKGVRAIVAATSDDARWVVMITMLMSCLCRPERSRTMTTNTGKTSLIRSSVPSLALLHVL